MAAEMVGSVVAHEAVNQVLSRIKEGYADKSDAKEHIERMEMAHIKLEAALETSHKWEITSPPLLRWQRKLKRATEECDHTLRQCRQRLEAEEEVKKGLQGSSFPKRIAHTAMSFVSSIFSSGSDDKLRESTAVRQFERYADGATEYLRYVELGGTPCRHMFSVAVVRHLLSGNGTKYCFVHGGQHLSLILQPFSPPNQGMEGSLMFILEDGNAPENNFILTLNLQLSESTDIVGVAVSCLQLFIPYLSSTTEIAKSKLTQVPMQDLCWVFDAYSVYGCMNNLIIFTESVLNRFDQTHFFCQLDHPPIEGPSSKSLPCDRYLEPVIQVYLLGHRTLSLGSNRQSAVVDRAIQRSPTRKFPYLKLGVHFWPHASFEDLSLAVGGSASEIINNEAEQCGMYANISFEQLGEITMPKAVDCLSSNVAATLYQIFWKSKHGSAYLRAEKISWGATTRKDKVGKRRKQQQDKKVLVQGWTSGNSEFISSWIAHVPAQLQVSIFDYWIEKQERPTLPLLLKTNHFVHDCPIMLFSLQDTRYLARKLKVSSTFNP